MSAYTANITGSNSYWFKRKIELEATFEQKKPATLFFTFSCADIYWHDLQSLMPKYYNQSVILNDISQTEKYRNCIENPHLVDYYFGIRLNIFLQNFFDKGLECEWRWHRYEWQHRTVIHGHGMARLKNDPNLINLASKVYIGRELLKNQPLVLTETDNPNYQNYLNIINEYKQAEKIIIEYADTLITAWNNKMDSNDKLNEQHPCSQNIETLNENELDSDYNNLINSCQRHKCSSYCLKRRNKETKCRFNYPFELQNETSIVFTKNEKTGSVKAEILFKRNDPYMNVHNQTMIQQWRANMDFKIILDLKYKFFLLIINII
jgi:hypothetical protein